MIDWKNRWTFQGLLSRLVYCFKNLLHWYYFAKPTIILCWCWINCQCVAVDFLPATCCFSCFCLLFAHLAWAVVLPFAYWTGDAWIFGGWRSQQWEELLLWGVDSFEFQASQAWLFWRRERTCLRKPGSQPWRWLLSICVLRAVLPRFIVFKLV